jgi:hypothetical protein
MSTAIKGKLEAEVRAALAAAGGDPGGVNKAEIAKKYISLGVSRATAFRWIAGALLHTAADAPSLPKSSARRPDDVAEMAAMLAVASDGLDEIVSPSSRWIIDGLRKCLRAAHDVIAHSRKPDGSIRIGKTLVAASEHLRRVIETTGRLQDQVAAIQKIDALHDELLAAVAQVSPAVHARVVARLGDQASTWRSGTAAAP